MAELLILYMEAWQSAFLVENVHFSSSPLHIVQYFQLSEDVHLHLFF